MATPYELVKSCMEDLKKTIKSDLVWIAGQLYEEEIVLTDAQYNEVTDSKSMLSEDERAAEVTKRLLARVDLDSDYLEEFVKILKKKEKKFRPLLKKLEGGSGGGGGGTQDAISQVG